MIVRSKFQTHLFCSLYGFAEGLTKQLPCLPPTPLSPGGSSIFNLSLVTYYFLIPCYVLLSCPLLCCTFLSLVMCYLLVPCHVLFSCPLLWATYFSLVMCYFFVLCYMLLSCPLLCVTFLSLVVCYFLVPCYVLLSCPVICVSFLSHVMCYFLVPCFVLLISPLLCVTCCTSHSDGTYLGHQVVTCHLSFITCCLSKYW